MGLLTKVMDIAADGEYVLARDLLALAFADGKVTDTEKEAIARICHMEEIPDDLFAELILKSTLSNAPTGIPISRKDKEAYLTKLIQVMGADTDCATEEILILEIIAGKLGYNRLQLTSLVLTHSTHRDFSGDSAPKVLSTFLSNLIDPKGKSDHQNRTNIAKIFDSIAESTPVSNTPEEDAARLQTAFEKAADAIMANDILVREFRGAGIDLKDLLTHEGRLAMTRWAHLNHGCI